MAKVQITIDDELLSRVDECSDKLYTTRSGFITQACNALLNQFNATNAIADIAACMRRIADSNQITDEDKKALEQFEAFAKIVCGK